jgi:hypothetical protein
VALPVVTVASGGLPVADVTATAPKLGLPVSEATNLRGLAVTKVGAGKPGLPVTWADAAGGSATPATFDGVNSAAVSTSNGGRTATITSSVPNVGARSTAVKTTGKYYFEMTCGSIFHGCCGLLTSGGTYADVLGSGTNCAMALDSSGAIYSNNVNSGKAIGAYTGLDVVCFAVDLTGRLVWCRKGSANWNGTAGADPAAGTGSVVLAPTVGFSPMVTFSGSAFDSLTINCGQAAYAFTRPSGFNDWTV